MTELRHAEAGARPRLASIDLARGFAITAMIVVNHPGSSADTFSQLQHSVWHGWTFADTIFPLFLWIVGLSITVATTARLSRGATRSTLLRHALRRTLILLIVGLLLVNFSFPAKEFPFFQFSSGFQATGVLQKIASCYLIATAIFVITGWKGTLAAAALFTGSQLALHLAFPVPICGAGHMAPDCNFPGYLDGLVLGEHRWGNTGQDPDGLGTILQATVTVQMGVLAGWILQQRLPTRRTIAWLLAFGAVLLGSAAVFSLWTPINKPLWTPAYSVLMAGFATVTFAGAHWVADVRGLAGRLALLQTLGRHALFAYVVSQLGRNLPKIHLAGWSLNEVWRSLLPAEAASLLAAIVYLLLVTAAIRWLDSRRWVLSL